MEIGYPFISNIHVLCSNKSVISLFTISGYHREVKQEQIRGREKSIRSTSYATEWRAKSNSAEFKLRTRQQTK